LTSSSLLIRLLIPPQEFQKSCRRDVVTGVRTREEAECLDKYIMKKNPKTSKISLKGELQPTPQFSVDLISSLFSSKSIKIRTNRNLTISSSLIRDRFPTTIPADSRLLLRLGPGRSSSVLISFERLAVVPAKPLAAQPITDTQLVLNLDNLTAGCLFSSQVRALLWTSSSPCGF
jgi:hypothetical protein